MSCRTYITHGYGFCVSEIITTREQIEELLKKAPLHYKKEVDKWLKENNITEPTIEDYMDFTEYYEEISNVWNNGLASILQIVIDHCEKIETTSVCDYDNNWFLLLCPAYPWDKISSEEAILTEYSLSELFKKYINILTNDTIEIKYQSVENFG